jgi:hypothetical protein
MRRRAGKVPNKRNSVAGYLPNFGTDIGGGRKQFAVRLSHDEAEWLNRWAEASDVSVTSLLRAIVQDRIANLPYSHRIGRAR